MAEITTPSSDIDVRKYKQSLIEWMKTYPQYIACTYITIYKGNKLPPFYIGSTYINRIIKGYNGSVSSKKFKEIWQEERRLNKHLFETFVISAHETRNGADVKENKLHIQLNVVDNPLYINRNAYSNGYKRFTMDEDMKTHLSKMHRGKKLSDETKEKIRQQSLLYRHNEESKNKIRQAHIGKKKQWVADYNNNRDYNDPKLRENMSKAKRKYFDNGGIVHNKGKSWDIETKIKNSMGQNPKRLFQFDLNENLIKEWDSIYIASLHLGFNRNSLRTKAYKGEKYKGFIWKMGDKLNG